MKTEVGGRKSAEETAHPTNRQRYGNQKGRAGGWEGRFRTNMQSMGVPETGRGILT